MGEEAHGVVTHDRAEASRLGRWLRELGMPAPASRLDAEWLPEWRDGLRLCELVEVLERRQLAGVTRTPRSSASFRHNIEKALDALRHKPGMAADWLYCTNQVLQGRQSAIVGLLRDVRRAYHRRG